MDNRSFQSGAAASAPSAPALPSAGYPTNGNPSTATAATVPGEYWFHQIGEELRTVITAAGLTPSNTVLNQLLSALNAGWGMAKSLTNPGYVTLPGGLILQFGTANSASSSGAITFPVAFPNACFMRLVANSDTGVVTPAADPTVLNSWNVLGNSGFNWECTNANTNALASPGEFIWLAIGH